MAHIGKKISLNSTGFLSQFLRPSHFLLSGFNLANIREPPQHSGLPFVFREHESGHNIANLPSGAIHFEITPFIDSLAL